MAGTRKASTNGYKGAPYGRVLVADDDPAIRDVLSQLLEGERYTVEQAADGKEVLVKAGQSEDERPDAILLDYKLPDLDGIQVLQRLLEQGIDVPVILITGMTAGSLAIRAMQMGAADYLRKPFTDLDEVVIAVQRVLDYERLKRTVAETLPPTVGLNPTERIVGSTPEMIGIFKLVGRVARTPATVLITGETGTGKELIAEATHNASDRRSGPMIKVNCAALPETLLESELFGHEKGAFTGAIGLHKGRFEAADKGTIFLDEVGEMSLATQKKLLRVLQEREFERVGGTVPVKVDVRVLAATNRSLREEVLGGVREDLFYRRHRCAYATATRAQRTFPALVNHFLDKHRYSAVSIPARISEEAMAELMAHDWPGNVRELENIVQRAVVLSRGELITEEHIVFQNELNRYVLDVEQRVRAGARLDEMLRDVKREALVTALRLNDHDDHKAAEALGLDTETFQTYMEDVALVREPAR